MQINGAVGECSLFAIFCCTLEPGKQSIEQMAFSDSPIKGYCEQSFPHYCANYKPDVCLIGYTVRAIISDKQGGMQDEFNGYSKERQ